MSTQKLAIVLLGALSATVVILAGPAAVHFVVVRAGFALPDFSATIGPWQARLALAFSAAVGLGIVCFALTDRAAIKRPVNLTLIALTCVALLAMPLWYYRSNAVENQPIRKPPPERIYPSIAKLDLRNVDIRHPVLRIAYDRSRFPDDAFDSFESFHEFAKGLYEQARPFVEENWRIKHDAVRRVAFYAAVVGSLFEYGNKDKPDVVGCTYNNELTGGPVGRSLTQEEFLRSRIGCCNDYAYLMKFMMDFDGIESRMLYGAGHIWNEFVVDGRTYNVDANTGLLVASAWDALPSADKIKVWRLPLAGSMTSAGERYRPVLGAFVQYMLARITDGGFRVKVLDEVPTEFPLELAAD